MNNEEHAKFDPWVIEQLTADLTRAQAETARLRTSLITACAERDALNAKELCSETLAELAQAKTEVEDRDVKLAQAHVKLAQALNERDEAEADYVLATENAVRTQQELGRERQITEGLKRKLAKTEAKHLHWFGIAQKRAWRQATLDAAEAALANCGLAGIRDEFNGLADAIQQMAEHIKELTDERDQLDDRVDDAMAQIEKYDKSLVDNLLQYAVEDVLARLVEAEHTVHIHEHALNERDKALQNERQLRHEAEQHAEALVANTREAIDWLWGFYHGNTLIAKPGYEDDIREAWDRLLIATDSEGANEYLQGLCTERQLRQEAEQYADGMKCGRDHWRTAWENVTAELAKTRQLRQEAERCHKAALALAQSRGERAERAESKIIAAHKALDECSVKRDLLNGEPAGVIARIFRLNRRADHYEALAALVTPELANLLVLLASSADTSVQYHRCTATAEDTKNARAHAARIRAALETGDETR